MVQLAYALGETQPLQPGQPLYGDLPLSTISRPVGGGTTQITTVEVTGVTSEAVHSLDITYNGATVRVNFTADGSATTAEVAAGLEAALDDEPELGGLFAASVSSSTITLTGRVPGQSWVASQAGSLVATITDTQSAANATQIPFGRGVVQRESYPREALLPSTANDTLLVIHATPTAGNAAIYSISVSFNLGDGNGPRTVVGNYTADGSATAQEIVEALKAQLNGALPANSIDVDEDDAKLILTSEVPNLRFAVTASVSTGVTAWTVSVATALVPLRFLGVTLQSHTLIQDANGVAAYQGGDPMSIAQEGHVAVELDANITPSVGDPVWCRASASGSEVLGAFRDAQDGADCIFIPNAQWVEDSAYTYSGVRVAKLRLTSGNI